MQRQEARKWYDALSKAPWSFCFVNSKHPPLWLLAKQLPPQQPSLFTFF